MTHKDTFSNQLSLLAQLPYRMGYYPEDSVVLAALHGRRHSQIGLVIRVDVNDFAHGAASRALATNIVSHLRSDSAAAAFLALYSAAHDPVLGQEPPELFGLASQLCADAALEELGSCYLWWVGPTAIGRLEQSGQLWRVAWITAREDLQYDPGAVQMVLEGKTVAPSRQSLVKLDTVSPERRRSAARAANRWRSQMSTDSTLRDSRREGGLQIWRELVNENSVAPSALQCGKFAGAIADVTLRDAILLDMLGSSSVADLLLRETRRGETPGAAVTRRVSAALGKLFDEGSGIRPPLEKFDHMVNILRAVAAHLPQRQRAETFTLLCILFWWRGDGARANIYLDQALKINPAYSMAELMEQALTGGIAPGWVRRQRSRQPA